VRHKADSHNLNAVSSYNSSFIQPQPSQQNSQPITTEAETKLMQNQFPKCFKMVWKVWCIINMWWILIFVYFHFIFWMQN